MPKRTSEKIEYYNAKIRKLQRDAMKKRRRVIVYSSSDSEEQIENGAQLVDEHNNVDEAPASEPPLPPPVGISLDEAPLEPEVPELDPELLEALGDTSDDTPVYGPDIHATLAHRWLPILKKGLQADAKEKLLKEYTVPSNCKLLKAPALNPEISAAVLDVVRNRDKKIQTKQDQLGLGISAVNKAMTLLLTGDDKVNAIKVLSDCCRILTDLHYTETQVRAKLITPGLEKSFLTLIQDQERDETLFGSKLSEKIKASKAIEKQGLQIKKASSLKPSTPNAAPSTARYQNQGNWSGASRYSTPRRGGRTNSYRGSQAYRRPMNTPPAVAQAPRSTPASSFNRRAPWKQ